MNHQTPETKKLANCTFFPKWHFFQYCPDYNGYYMFFTQNILGLSAVVVGMVATLMRVFDGITDPPIGVLIDRTNTKFGRFRPFMMAGCILGALSQMLFFILQPVLVCKGDIFLPHWLMLYMFWDIPPNYLYSCSTSHFNQKPKTKTHVCSMEQRL